MFVPEGYMPLIDVKYACRSIARERYSNNTPVDDLASIDWDALFGFSDVPPKEIDPRQALYARLLLDRFIGHFLEEIYVFQYPNILLRAAPEIFYSELLYDGPCPDDKDEARSAMEHLGKNRLNLVSEAMRFDLNIGEDTLRIATEALGKEFVETAMPVSGAVLCWRTETLQSELENILCKFHDEQYWLGVHPDFPAEDVTELEDAATPRGGRPEKVGKVAAAYRTLFPNGHGDKTRKQIAKQLRIETGISFGLDTLDRALKLAKHSA
ncbi:hypothetical protein [Pararhodobacter oceanensis]|uniref:hypothetical protein n=1 Tax=Pararhodobacter oceanensis TaxID=2172121 RepID=UPI003A94425F